VLVYLEHLLQLLKRFVRSVCRLKIGLLIHPGPYIERVFLDPATRERDRLIHVAAQELWHQPYIGRNVAKPAAFAMG
jgi:hypothetical protein